MSSYLSKPKEFNSFQPEVDPNLYGQILQKKERMYEEGVQRVEATRESVASLPIASAGARNYTQQKLNAVTSELNQQHNVDWSDQGVQKMTGKHITAIADDPIVQNAVTDTARYRKDYQDAKQSHEDNGGKDIANQWAFNQPATQWLNSGDPATRYGGKFTSFVDADKEGYDVISKVKPEWRKIDHPADPSKGPVYQQWSKWTESWEEVPEYEVRNILQSHINNNPSLADQLHVNAQYSMKDYTAVDYAKHQGQLNQAQVSALNNSKEYLNKISSGLVEHLPDELVGKSPEQVNAWVMSKNKELDDSIDKLNNHDYLEDILKWGQSDSEEQDKFKSDLYKGSYIDEMTQRVSGRKKYSYEVTGDPYDRLMKQREYERQVVKDKRDASHQGWEEGHGDAELAFQKSKFKIEHPETVNAYSQDRTGSNTLTTAWNNFTDTYKRENDQLGEDMNKFLYYNLGNPDLVKQLFNNVNGVITAKDPAKVTAYMNDYYKAVSSGNPKGDHSIDGVVQGQKITIPESAINQTSDIMLRSKNVHQLYYQQLKAHSEEKGSEYDLITPLIKALPGKLPEINRLGGTNFTVSDVNSFINDAGSNKELLSDISRLRNLGYDINADYYGYAPEVEELYNKYGNGDIAKGKQKLYKFYQMTNTPEINEIVYPHQEAIDKQAEYYNNFAKNIGFTPVVLSKDISTGDKDTDPLMRDRLKSFQEIKDAMANESIVSEALTPKESPKGIKIQAKVDGGTHYITFTDKGTTKTVAINDPIAIKEIFSDIPQAYSSPTKTLIASSEFKSNYTGGRPNWQESILVSRDPKTGLELRKGITYNPLNGGYTIHMYKGKTLSDAKEIHTQDLGSDLDNISKTLDDERRQNGIIR